jgi:peroxiredoxin
VKSHIQKTAFVILLIGVAFCSLYLIGKKILPSIVGETITVESKKIPQSIQELIGLHIPSFDLPDTKGNRIRSGNFAGVPLVIFFWSTWNKEAANGIQVLDDYTRNYEVQAKLIHTIAINSQEDPSIVTSFIKRGGYTVSVANDVFGETTNSYKVNSLPTIFFVDKNGTIRDVHIGLISSRMFVEKVENLLKPIGVQ